MKFKILILITGFLYVNIIIAQQKNLDATILYGFIARHSPKLIYKPTSNVEGLEVGYSTKDSSKSFASFFHYPTVGMRFLYCDFNSDVMGKAFAIYPYLQYKIGKNISMNMGWGLGYVTEKYNPIDNIENNYVGANINNITAIDFNYLIKWDSKWSTQFGFGLRHFSDGGTVLPNYGINFVNFNANTRFLISNKNIIKQTNSISTLKKKWGVEYEYQMGKNESIANGGPQYPVFINVVGLSWSHNPFRKTTLQLAWERHKWVEAFGLNNGKYNTIVEARDKSGRISAQLGQEFKLDRVSIITLLGVYIPNGADFIPSAFYEKLGIRYYFIDKKKLKTNIGIYMKAHKTIAEYFSLGLGISY
jgi:Lipid A 3-O-deacylase (PagL)